MKGLLNLVNWNLFHNSSWNFDDVIKWENSTKDNISFKTVEVQWRYRKLRNGDSHYLSNTSERQSNRVKKETMEMSCLMLKYEATSCEKNGYRPE